MLILLSVPLEPFDEVKVACVAGLCCLCVDFGRLPLWYGGRWLFGYKVPTLGQVIQLQPLHNLLPQFLSHLLLNLRPEQRNLLPTFLIDQTLNLHLIPILLAHLLKIPLVLIPLIDLDLERILAILVEILFHLADEFALDKMLLSQIWQLFLELIFSAADCLVLSGEGLVEVVG